MLSTGVRTDLGIKIFGDNLDSMNGWQLMQVK
jgi:Cu/Ag efflux pump CusA